MSEIASITSDLRQFKDPQPRPACSDSARRQYEVGVQRAAPANVYGTPVFEYKLVLHEGIGRLTYVDPAGNALRLHATRGVHGVAPDVIPELVFADHTRDERPGIEADAHREAAPVGRAVALDEVPYVQGHAHRCLGVIEACAGDTTHPHPVIAGIAYLLDAVPLGELIDARKHVVEDA